MSSTSNRPRFAALLLALATACVAPPTAEDYLAVGFRSPEQAFQSYQTAFAGNQIDLEYRSLGRDFRNAQGIDGMTYRLAREQILKENPFIKWVAAGDIIESKALGPDRHRLTIQVKNWLTDTRFYVYLQREDFFEAWVDERSAFFAFADEDDPHMLYAVAQAPPEVDPSEITELNFGREWRIAGFESIPTESSASSTP
jgi:hypothetical protein